jgi:hypothetical protein
MKPLSAPTLALNWQCVKDEVSIGEFFFARAWWSEYISQADYVVIGRRTNNRGAHHKPAMIYSGGGIAAAPGMWYAPITALSGRQRFTPQTRRRS